MITYEKKCLRCGAVTDAAKWPGKAMEKTMCRAICKEMTTHHFSEQAAMPAVRRFAFGGPRGATGPTKNRIRS